MPNRLSRSSSSSGRLSAEAQKAAGGSPGTPSRSPLPGIKHWKIFSSSRNEPPEVSAELVASLMATGISDAVHAAAQAAADVAFTSGTTESTCEEM